jgi:16S rRNA (guanine527-N7)-methyltransferase
MKGIDLILKYFPELSDIQINRFIHLENLYREWNPKINVISRKDIDHLYEKHVLHSLGIAKIVYFNNGTKVIDVGTGGGFPGIPLAIIFPEVHFFLVDSIGKKIKVVQAIIEKLNLQNAIAEKIRAEDVKQTFDFIVSRAVTSLPEFCKWVSPLLSPEGFNDLRNGILYLKGGDLTHELKLINGVYHVFSLSSFFTEEFFETKKIIHLTEFT